MHAAGIQRVLLNLLSNSVKHTAADGRILVSLALAPPEKRSAAPASAIASIAVKDDGEGMPADFVRKGLFEPFVQGRDATAGAGLGMSLTRNIVQRMHGSIDVQSAVGKGTTVIVNVPVELSAPVKWPAPPTFRRAELGPSR